MTLEYEPAALSHLSHQHFSNAHLLGEEIGVVDVFLQLHQDLRFDIVFVVVFQTLEEIGISQYLFGTGPVRSVKTKKNVK